MKIKDYKAPYFSYENIRKFSNEFLDKYNSENIIPVPIEEIVEFKFNITVIPTEDLHEKIETDGFISCNLTEIYVDKWVYDNREARTRFTIAHEIGHALLHKELYDNVKFKSLDEWKEIFDSIPAQQYSYLQLHANNFAGLILVPSNNLQTKFKEAIQMLKDNGFDPNDLYPSNPQFEYLSNWIAKRFNVSPEVIGRRIGKEGLLN